jgi:hypothetical protein
MQFTHYRPDEDIGTNDLRPASTIAGDNRFAKAAVDEKSALLSKAGLQDRTKSARQRIRQSFKGTGKMAWVWLLEVFFFIFTIFFIAYEFWTSCTRDVGLPHCYGCYTSSFLTWSAIWLCLWVTHLYTFLLLVSRDFEMYIGGGILSELMTNVLDRGIPRQGVVFYVAESAVLTFWWVVGIGVLISSNSCFYGGRIYGNLGRSGLLFWWILLNILFWIPLMIFGRFHMHPAKYLYKKHHEEPKKPKKAPPPVAVPVMVHVPVPQPVVLMPAPAPVVHHVPAPVPVHVPVAAPVQSMQALPAMQPVLQPAVSTGALQRVGSMGALPMSPRSPVAGGSVVIM